MARHKRRGFSGGSQARFSGAGVCVPAVDENRAPNAMAQVPTIKEDRRGDHLVSCKDPGDRTWLRRNDQSQIKQPRFLDSAMDAGRFKAERDCDAASMLKSCLRFWHRGNAGVGGGLGVCGRSGQAGFFGKPEHKIHRLDGLASRALDQIVHGSNGHHPTGPLIGIDADVAVI